MAPRGRRIPIASESIPSRPARTPSARWPRRRSLAARLLCAAPSVISSRSTSTWTVWPATVRAVHVREAPRSRRRRPGAWAATHPWSRSWDPAAGSSRWAEGRGRSRPTSGARYTPATRAAASRVARAGGGWTPITSSIGRMAAQPASTTWWCSVGTIIGWSTRVATRFAVPRPASWNSGARTGARSLLRLPCRSLASLPADSRGTAADGNRGANGPRHVRGRGVRGDPAARDNARVTSSSIHVSVGDVAATLALVAVAVAVSFWRRADLERDIGIAVVRSFIQLTAIGYVIKLDLRPGQPLVRRGAARGDGGLRRAAPPERGPSRCPTPSGRC